MTMLTLYHFTNREALTDIVLDGELRPSDRSLDREGDGVWPAHNAPDIVWMTTDPTPGWCCEGSDVWRPRRYAVRLTLRVPEADVFDLKTWGIRHKVFPEHAEMGPMSEEGRHFRCIERPVMAHTEWVAIDDMHEDGLCPEANMMAPYDTPEARQAITRELVSRPGLSPSLLEPAVAAWALLLDPFRGHFQRSLAQPPEPSTPDEKGEQAWTSSDPNSALGSAPPAPSCASPSPEDEMSERGGPGGNSGTSTPDIEPHARALVRSYIERAGLSQNVFEHTEDEVVATLMGQPMFLIAPALHGLETRKRGADT